MTVTESRYPEVTVGGFKTISCDRTELAEYMLEDCLVARDQGDSWLPKLVFSSNGQGLALAGKSDEFKKTMDKADIIHADGMPVVFASKFTEAPLPERIPTTDFFHDAAKVAVPNGLRFFMLGATEEQNDLAVKNMQSKYPDIKIVGSHHGYFSEDDDEFVCGLIRQSQADVVWIALGKPRQEAWCVRNRERLRGVGWLKTCGGLYSFLAGDAPRAPQWMQKTGLEWLYRLLDDPKRLAWRYLTTNPHAMYRLVRHTKKSGQSSIA
ncbi:WecB/TagA/CpsF family glycosyltransferase [Glutamicibacter sp.]|uniref:WecB/TagA/CpsF family glycosyltransferase n=1 Tax=Glutamicibacter sp. TaxID=1931995 RepID=UPI0028BF12E2|nr:WecB/TagA/CpsF family glycosyltransferase [Glutamicibacter sp.]